MAELAAKEEQEHEMHEERHHNGHRAVVEPESTVETSAELEVVRVDKQDILDIEEALRRALASVGKVGIPLSSAGAQQCCP